MTIHKSKGIEADCVLVLASSESQLFKWLEMNGEDMKSETDEDYRLGYVALTRARKVLILCCLKEIDIVKIDPEIFSIIHS
jgi:DNA helicase-2/ATP-dependent DNA helicase PcrA